LADPTENEIDQAVAKTAGGTAMLKDKIFGAVKKVTGGA
jgi:hypothetical protein